MLDFQGVKGMAHGLGSWASAVAEGLAGRQTRKPHTTQNIEHPCARRV